MSKKLTNHAIKWISLCLSALLLATPVSARDYNDRKEILDTGFVLDTERELSIARPSKDISTTESTYYITGSSDATASLTCNGEKVESRGVYGTFGVFVELEDGKNVFTFKNGSEEKTVCITKEKQGSGSGIYTVDKLKKTGPSADSVVKSQETYKIRCTAPANGSVYATLDGNTVKLKQEAVAETGVEAYYSATIDLPKVANGDWKNLGKIRYDLDFDGKSSTVESEGCLYVLGQGAALPVRVNQNAAVLYEEGKNDANQVSLVSRGAVDKVVESSDTHYKLSMGSWILKSYVDVLEESNPKHNKISKTSYRVDEGEEEMLLHGTTAPIYKSYNTSEKISIKLYNTSGVALKNPKSELFSEIKVTETGKDTLLEFYKEDGKQTVGYDVYYEDGNTYLYFNEKPSEGSWEKPLRNMKIVVDPGHGGLDGGAPGVLYGKNAPTEKDIAMAQGLVLKNRLESLGAEVFLTILPDHPKDHKVELTDRVEKARESKADFYISLHCNSIAENANGLKPEGTEIYYYENNSKKIADDILQNISDYTGRKARQVIYSNYYVTRTPMCPSMLVEMGFVSNPVEYDAMCTPDSLYQTANAVADALISYLED